MVKTLISPRKLALALATALATPLAAQAADTLASTIPRVVDAHTATLVMPAPADRLMHLVVSLPQRHQAELDALVRDITDPKSPHFRQYLSTAAFTERFGPSAADYEAAVAFFAANGLTVEARTPNRFIIDVAGNVADLNRVFHVSLGMYQHPTENRLFISPDRAPSLDLATPVLQVIGLDDFVRPSPKFVHDEKGARGGTGPGGNFDGNDLRTAYYPGGTLTGSGQSVGLMELVGYNIADVNTFFSKGYGPKNSVQVVGIKTDSQSLSCTGSCDDGEQSLDIEYAISLAPGLDSVRVYVGSSPEDVLNAMASDNISKSLSTSWGWNENFATDDALFKEFAVQGQTNLTASGDYSNLQASGPWPEEDANIVAVGGTDVETKTPGGLWSSETGWDGSAGGPSVDKSIKIEPYQLPFVTKANKASTTLRNVPDIAANANTNMYICADGGCFGGYGGTSFASPIWAGIIALANQQATTEAKPVVGFINPTVYALGGDTKYKKYFHDEIKGTSGLYRCTPSWDMVTGMGSPKGQRFIDALVNH